MAMTLKQESRPARVMLSGTETVEVAAEKDIQIRYWGPGAVDVLAVTVPAGKVWTVTFNVHIVETDV